MQPLGRKAIRFPGKTDGHYKRPFVNWWENNENTSENKAASKREVWKLIQRELQEAERV